MLLSEVNANQSCSSFGEISGMRLSQRKMPLTLGLSWNTCINVFTKVYR